MTPNFVPMPASRTFVTLPLAALLAIAAPATAVGGQQADSAQMTDTVPAVPPRTTVFGPLPRIHHGDPFTALVTVGGALEDRARMDHLLGRGDPQGFLIRSPSSLSPAAGRGGRPFPWAVILPEARMVVNSTLPFSINEGGMWAGRGRNLQVMAGVRVDTEIASLVLAPRVLLHSNDEFQTVPAPVPSRHPLSSLWHHGLNGLPSADLPQRFGFERFTDVDLGQSSLTMAAGPIRGGVATENQWWGPGWRNGIVMSNNAPGFPHLFLRTGAPLVTRIGTVEGKWIAGRLADSPFFDTLSPGRFRALSAVAATFRPAAAPDLTLGVTRTVFAPVDGTAQVLQRALDVFFRSGRQPVPTGTATEPGPDQITSLFARWIFPADHLEVYGEWARAELPRSLRDLLVTPDHSQGYTLGLQWAQPLHGSALLRVQAELTQLEMSAAYRVRPSRSFYVSHTVPQGYTHRGQVIGAASGPGSSTQWGAADYLTSRWGVGALAGRIRWENDAYYTQAGDGRMFLAHDVSTFWGIRGRAWTGPVEIGAEMIQQSRLNFLFQNWSQTFEGENAVDRGNTTFRIVVSPVRHAR